jgi:DNA polymerase delta subunit OB-fold domain
MHRRLALFPSKFLELFPDTFITSTTGRAVQTTNNYNLNIATTPVVAAKQVRTMTLMTIAATTRLYAEQSPGWQRFQTTLSAATNGTASSSAQQQINNNITQQHPYQRQYSHVYYQRLAVLGPIVWKRIRSCYSVGGNNEHASIIHTTRILELPEDTLCSCVGTLIVERDLKPQPIEDDTVELLSMNTSQDNCTFYLEDESGRVSLNFSTWWKNYSDLTNDKDSASDNDDKHSLGGSLNNDTPIDHWTCRCSRCRRHYASAESLYCGDGTNNQKCCGESIEYPFYQ